jgi:hypothetical protein
MRLIQSISSTLRTWVFKKKLLRFSERFSRDPQACFYCPEMCRFSCPTAETLKSNTVTPRGKMSLLHLSERGYSDAHVAGSSARREWFLEQCTGCGRCTEFCVHEVDVASNLRDARKAHFAAEGASLAEASTRLRELAPLHGLKGIVLLCEPGRLEWWKSRPALLEELGVREVADAALPHREWAWGKLGDEEADAVGEALSGCSQLWVESPEAAWFLARGVKHEREALRAEVRLVWQKFFHLLATSELGPDAVFHESFHLSRQFPRLGYSIPMYEKGFMPFHGGWNAWDCGGESFYPVAHPGPAKELGRRFLEDLEKDGRRIGRIVCQSLSCAAHLRELTGAAVTYWLDEVGGEA